MNSTRHEWAWGRTLVLGVIMAATIVTGCERPRARRASRQSVARQSSEEDLEKAFDYLRRLDEFERDKATQQAAYHLNNWVRDQTALRDWQPDDLVKTLPREIREGPEIARLHALRFSLEDADNFVEAVWLQDLAGWVPSTLIATPLMDEVLEQADSLDDLSGEQLIVAYRLFDWTVRNVQLDKLLEYPADAVAVGARDRRAGSEQVVPPPQRLIPGPGYQLPPWQVLLYGHGDSLARARLFILLARQRGIPVVMLAFRGLTQPPRPRPWMTAALIHQQLYLFDTQLGLPIPGPEGRPIATLAEVREDPTLLSRLSVGEDLKYEVAARDLRTIDALIDASATALSMRAQLVEKNLTGENRIAISVNPTQIARQLTEIGGIDDIVLWRLPFETAWYRAAMAKALDTEAVVAAEHYIRYGAFDTRTALARGRYAHFSGQFERRGDSKGAKSHYLDSRIPNKTIEQLRTSPAVQEAFGMQRNAAEGEVSWQSRLTALTRVVGQTKTYASYWLGIAHHESGNPVAGREWFQRVLDSEQETTWKAGARFNLGRVLESIGEIEAARQIYLADQSNQQHGNALRARLLRKHVRE